MRTRLSFLSQWMIPMVLTLLLSGCGTNVMYLLKEESRIMAEADALVTSAEDAGNGLERPVYEAEAAKDEACRFLHSAVFDRFNRDPGFFEQLVSDFSAAVALMVPVGQVEDCADAFDSYSAAVDSLAGTLSDSAELQQPNASAEMQSSVN